MVTDANNRVSPVVDTDEFPSGRLEDTWGLCLSGGGYRAMLFHLGALWRLNEAGYLPRFSRISSVSGGSITAAVLSLNWKRLRFKPDGVAGAFVDQVVLPVRRLAGRTIDIGAIVRGVLFPGPIANQVAKAYRKHLFGDATLHDLPDSPRFIINATNVQSGVLWRFMKPYMRDYKVGEVRQPGVALALAVSASSGFPPFLSPLHLPLDPQSFTPGNEPLHKPPFTTRVVLTDGGVYDNLGLETVWKRCKTVFVSDGGGQMNAEPKPRRDWLRHAKRVGDIIDNQVRSLRKLQVVRSYEDGSRAGAYWGIRTPISDYGAGVRLSCPHEKTLLLANLKTRLAKLDCAMQERLINWGYAVCDAALRRYFDHNLADPAGFPYPRGID